ncbi:DUF89 domain-containing protein [Atractiella rhizophila]|nr:DUF89 domain-containing protein [Atractiella rhizophila]
MVYYIPPYPVASASQRSGPQTSFAYESTVRRWPQILTSAIDGLNKLNFTLEDESLKREEGKFLISEIARLKHEISRDRELSEIEDDGEPTLATYNDLLRVNKEKGKGTWFTGDWLYNECYLYRRLRSLFSLSEHFKTYDPFFNQKVQAFRSSGEGVYSTAISFEKLRVGLDEDGAKKKTAFLEIALMSLWGNATDLSLLTNMTAEDIRRLQQSDTSSGGEEGREILANDLQDAWAYLSDLKDKKRRVDIVLDNSGFELYTDLIFADFLLSSSLTSKIVFHPKLIPYFVSDVTPSDFVFTFEVLKDPDFFVTDSFKPSSEQKDALESMRRRWEVYVKDGRWNLSVPLDTTLGGQVTGEEEFWSGPLPYSDLPTQAPVLLKRLQEADLVVFKGDLNYRKLTGDAWWPTTTPFPEALGELAGKFPILALRTCKADVCVGLKEGKEEELENKASDWRRSGKFAVAQFCPQHFS